MFPIKQRNNKEKWKYNFIISVKACPAAPCLNSGTCNTNGLGGYTCSCLTGYTGINCEIGKFSRLIDCLIYK